MKMRLIETDYPDDPHLNLAMDEAIFIEVLNGQSPPTFRFYRNGSSVILGCFQLAEQEIDIKYAVSKDIKIAKRFTGGGAVYHDMGNLNYSIISKDSFEIDNSVEKLFYTMIKGASTSLRDLGIDVAKKGLNDLSVKGKKVLGSAATMRSDTILFHAALLVNTDLEILASVLTAPGTKIREEGVSTMFDRVTNIKELSGKDVDGVKDAILEGYSKELGFEYEKGILTGREKYLMNRLHKEKYRRSEWNLGRELISTSY
jgi:lipoate---protein ligase